MSKNNILRYLFIFLCISFTAHCGSTPSIVTITFAPVDAATDQAGNVPVTLTFSAAVTDSTVTTDTINLTALDATTNLCTTVTYDSASLTATCAHANLTGGTTYTIATTGEIQDSVSHKIAAGPASFTVENTAPTATLVQPTPTSGSISVIFSESMDEETLAFTVTNESDEDMCESVNWDADTLTATCTLGDTNTPQCPPQTAVALEDWTVSVATTATDLAGNALAVELSQPTNALDDGFEAETLSDCWFDNSQSQNMTFDTTTNSGSLTITVAAEAGLSGGFIKNFRGSTIFAISVHLNNADIGNMFGSEAFGIIIEAFDTQPTISNRTGVLLFTNIGGTTVLLGGQFSPSAQGEPQIEPDATLSDSDLYLCIIRNDSTMTGFSGSDGTNFDNAIPIPAHTLSGASSSFAFWALPSVSGGSWVPQIDEIKFAKFEAGETPSCPTF